MNEITSKFMNLVASMSILSASFLVTSCDADTSSELKGQTGQMDFSEPDGYVDSEVLDEELRSDTEENQLEVFLVKLSNTEENIEHRKVGFKSVVFNIEADRIDSNLTFEKKNNVFQKLITPIVYTLEIELEVGSKCFVRGFYFGVKNLPLKCETGAIAKVEKQLN